MLVDGGLTNVLPIDIHYHSGTKKILGVDILSEYKEVRKSDIITVTSKSVSIMSKYLKMCSTKYEQYLLKVNIPQNIGLLDFDRMEECMEIGYTETLKNIEQIKHIFG